MPNHSEELNQRIIQYLTDIHTLKTRTETLESEVKEFKREIVNQKSLLKKLREEKAACLKEVKELKARMKNSE